MSRIVWALLAGAVLGAAATVTAYRSGIDQAARDDLDEPADTRPPVTDQTDRGFFAPGP